MKSVLKLPVCHFSYVNLVTEGALFIFFPEKKPAGGAYRSRGAKWGEYGILVGSHLGNIPMKFESHWPKASGGVSF